MSGNVSCTPARGLCRTLIDVGGFVVSELDLGAIVGRVLEAASELTGARYTALGVLDERGEKLERFVTRGVDDEPVGARPQGLGVLIADPRPLLASRVGEHPAACGQAPAGRERRGDHPRRCDPSGGGGP